MSVVANDAGPEGVPPAHEGGPYPLGALLMRAVAIFLHWRSCVDQWLLAALWRRAVFLVLILCMAAYVGWKVGELLWLVTGFDQRALREAIGTVTVASMLLTVYKIMAEHAKQLHAFIASNDQQGILGLVTELVAAFSIGGSAANLVVLPPEAPLPGVQSAHLQAFTLVSALGKQEMIANRLMLPFFPRSVENTRCDPDTGSWGGGERLSPEMQQSVLEIGCALRACSTTKDSVVIDVIGYASSKEFECQGDSEALNQQLATARRRSVIETLRRADRPGVCRSLQLSEENAGKFEIIAETSLLAYGNYEAMEAGRVFRDRPAADGPPERAREVLTRRADIVIEHAGDCSLR
jgi:hypothetical protein